MIEVQIDADALRKITHDISHSIRMIEVLKSAGIPLCGVLITKGIERGMMVWDAIEDLDGDVWRIRWYDTHEKPEHTYKRVGSGKGEAYVFTRYDDITVPPPPPPVNEDDEL